MAFALNFVPWYAGRKIEICNFFAEFYKIPSFVGVFSGQFVFNIKICMICLHLYGRKYVLENKALHRLKFDVKRKFFFWKNGRPSGVCVK